VELGTGWVRQVAAQSVPVTVDHMSKFRIITVKRTLRVANGDFKQ